MNEPGLPDVSFIAALLEGANDAGNSQHNPIPARPAPRRHSKRRTKRAPAVASDTTSIVHEAQPSAPYNQPSSQSSTRFHHCEACRAWVPSSPGLWETHIAGIRHRRQVLSLREHGQRGRLVVSKFEPLPGGELSSPHRLAGKAAKEFGLDSSATSKQAGSIANPRSRADPALRRLRTALSAALINMFGRDASRLYHRAVSYFDDSDLSSAVQVLDSKFQKTLRGKATYDEADSSEMVVKTPAELALLSHYVANPSALWYRNRLVLRVTLSISELSDSDDMEGDSGYDAALLAGLYNLISTLVTHPTDTEVVDLKFPDSRALNIVVYEQGMRHIMRGVRQLFEVNYRLSQFTLNLIPRTFFFLQGPGLLELWDETARHVDDIIHNRKEKVVLAFLMGTHERIGRCSPISMLPNTVVANIVASFRMADEDAVPFQFRVDFKNV
jgi:hypothetical protein